MRNVPCTNTEQNHDLVYEWNECKQGLNPGKIHAKPDNNKSFANQGFQATTWHVEWRHRESSYRAYATATLCASHENDRLLGR